MIIHWLTKDVIEAVSEDVSAECPEQVLCGADLGEEDHFYSELPIRRGHSYYSGLARFAVEPNCPACLLIRLAENCDG